MINQHTLYVDNYRGFSDTYIPLLDVNFLVGENSSGKTSILNILSLLSDERFLFWNQFNTAETAFDLFQDIVSAHADDRSYFRIGMMRWETSGQTRMPLGMLVTYKAHEGQPRDDRFTCTFGSKEISVRRAGTDILYRIRDHAVSPKTNLKRLFSRWTEEHRDGADDGFKKLEFPIKSEYSLLFPLSMLARGPLDKKSESGSFSLLAPTVFPDLAWIAPIRSKPQRTYDALRREFSPDGTHTPYLIRKTLDSSAQSKHFLRTIRRMGKESGLFQSVEIKRYAASDITAPFEVRIILDKKSFNLINVGYGVSQALPVLVEILLRRHGSWFAIQQPEVHLHPRGQAMLGDLIHTSASVESKRFLIETHSDFMIDRYRSNVRTAKGEKPSSQVLFFERRRNHNTVAALRIDDRGGMPAKQPKSYRSFFLKETIRALDL